MKKTLIILTIAGAGLVAACNGGASASTAPSFSVEPVPSVEPSLALPSESSSGLPSLMPSSESPSPSSS